MLAIWSRLPVHHWRSCRWRDARLHRRGRDLRRRQRCSRSTVMPHDALRRLSGLSGPGMAVRPEITKARTQRGIALMNDKVFVGTNDTRMIRLNAATGEVVWTSGRCAAGCDLRHPVARPRASPSRCPDRQRVAASSFKAIDRRPVSTISWVGAFDQATGDLVCGSSPCHSLANPVTRPGQMTTRHGGPAAQAFEPRRVRSGDQHGLSRHRRRDAEL